MAPQPDMSFHGPKKPSMLLAALAMVLAILLPFILVKIFPHKQNYLVDNVPMTLTSIDEETSTADEEEDIEEEEQTAQTAKPQPIASKEKGMKPSQTVTPLPESKWTVIKTRNKDTLANVFNRAGLSAKILHDVLQGNPHSRLLSQLKPDQDIQFQIVNNRLEKMIVPVSTIEFITVDRRGERYLTAINQRKMNAHNHFLTATIRGSLYGTAKKLNIPYKLIRQMSEIFTWDINFAKDVRAGDQFTIIYKAFYVGNKLVNTGDIVAVSYKNRGKVFQAVRHTNQAGISEYFTPEGNSLKKAFNRYPLRFSHISSSFSLSRYHPILHYSRAHKGVDLAARIGTPIQATGDGRIDIIGRNSGYGNMIKIKHNNTYSTIYGHMLKFQKGLSKGSYVRRGQLIGYVGQTGLASGPHCHYEVHINGQPKNPATINLPRGEPVSRRELARFKANTTSLLAQLKGFEEGKTGRG